MVSKYIAVVFFLAAVASSLAQGGESAPYSADNPAPSVGGPTYDGKFELCKIRKNVADLDPLQMIGDYVLIAKNGSDYLGNIGNIGCFSVKSEAMEGGLSQSFDASTSLEDADSKLGTEEDRILVIAPTIPGVGGDATTGLQASRWSPLDENTRDIYFQWEYMSDCLVVYSFCSTQADVAKDDDSDPEARCYQWALVKDNEPLCPEKKYQEYIDEATTAGVITKDLTRTCTDRFN